MFKSLKKISLGLGIIATTICNAQTPQWTDVGPEGNISTSTAFYQNLVFSKYGVPYIAYQSADNSSKTIVKKFNGAAWVAVGGATGFGASGVIEQKLVINSQSNNPIVSYVNENVGNSQVLSFNGIGWSALGSTILGYGTVLALSPTNVPYIAFNNTLNNIVIQSFSGSNWQDVGTITGTIPALSRFTLVFSPSGVPFVSYTDNSTTKLNVVSFNGTSWNSAGNPNFSAGDNAFQSLAFNSAGIPYIAYQDAANGNRTTVMSLSGSNWGLVGIAGFGTVTTVTGFPANSFSTYQSLDFNNQNVPYVAFSRNGSNTILRWNGANWLNLNGANANNGSGASSGVGNIHQCLEFDRRTNEPWVAFNGGTYNGTVKRYGINCLEVNPNLIPTITEQPISQTSCQSINEMNTFSVAGTGVGLFYEWSNGVQGNVMTTSVLGTNYRVTVSGACGKVTSSVFTNTAKVQTGFDVQPESKTVCGGTFGAFAFTAVGTPQLTYTWSGGTPSGNTMVTSVVGTYNVTISGVCGTAISNDVTLTNEFTSIETQPVSQTICKGNAATFSISVNGNNLSYNWNGDIIFDSQFVTTTAGMYTVTVGSRCGNVVANPVTLTTKETSIVTQPVSQIKCEGVAVSFVVSASGDNLSYLWAGGNTNRIFTTSTAGNYTVTVTGDCGSKISTTVGLSLRVCTFVGTKIPFNNVIPATLTGTNALLTWATLAGANTYCIRMSKTNTFTDASTKTVCGLAAAQYLVNITSPGTRTETDIVEEWFYQVAGVDANNEQTLWSDTQTFTTSRVDNTTNLSYELLIMNYGLLITPNPSTGLFTVKNAKSVTVYDMLGKVILSTSESSFIISSKGIFIAQVETENGKKFVKLVVE